MTAHPEDLGCEERLVCQTQPQTTTTISTTTDETIKSQPQQGSWKRRKVSIVCCDNSSDSLDLEDEENRKSPRPTKRVRFNEDRNTCRLLDRKTIFCDWEEKAQQWYEAEDFTLFQERLWQDAQDLLENHVSPKKWTTKLEAVYNEKPHKLNGSDDDAANASTQNRVLAEELEQVYKEAGAELVGLEMLVLPSIRLDSWCRKRALHSAVMLARQGRHSSATEPTTQRHQAAASCRFSRRSVSFCNALAAAQARAEANQQ